MDEKHYSDILATLKTEAIPTGVSSASNWRRLVRKFDFKTVGIIIITCIIIIMRRRGCLVQSVGNRKRGKLIYNEAFRVATNALKELGDYAHSKNCILTIEPLPSSICDFIINMKEALDLVEMVNSPGVKLHFDSGSADITENDADNDKMLELSAATNQSFD